MHFHSYSLNADGNNLNLALHKRLSTDSAGVAECLGIQADPKIELQLLVAELERKIGRSTLLTL